MAPSQKLVLAPGAIVEGNTVRSTLLSINTPKEKYVNLYGKLTQPSADIRLHCPPDVRLGWSSLVCSTSSHLVQIQCVELYLPAIQHMLVHVNTSKLSNNTPLELS